jgi:hypothetical protein
VLLSGQEHTTDEQENTMGTNTHIGYIKGTLTQQAALHQLIQELHDDEGNRASWRSHDNMTTLPGIMFRDQAIRLVEQRISENHMKGIYTGVTVACYDDADMTSRYIEVKGVISGDQWNAGKDAHQGAMEALAAAKMPRLRAGEVATAVSIASRPCGITVTAKVVAHVAKEKTETRFFVTGSDVHPNDLKWERGHVSQAAARAALTAALEALTGSNEATYDIEAVTRRTSGAPLVQMERKITKVAVTLRVRVQKANAGAERGGWVVSGFYHS